MITVATSTGTVPTPLVVRPVPPPVPDGSALAGANVVKLPIRAERLQRKNHAVDTESSGALRSLQPEAGELAMVEVMSGKVAQAALEVISGVRSVQQLARWLNTLCMNSLTTRARLHAEAGKAASRRHSNEPGSGDVHTLHHQPMVHSIHCSAVSPGIFETAVVIADKTRFRAVAMRFEQHNGLWKVTALRIG